MLTLHLFEQPLNYIHRTEGTQIVVRKQIPSNGCNNHTKRERERKKTL